VDEPGWPICGLTGARPELITDRHPGGLTTLSIYRCHAMRPPVVQLSPASSLRWSRRAGTGAVTIVCFHHAGGSVLSAARLASVLPADWGVAAVALPGHEGPESGTAPRRPEEIAGRIAEEIAALFSGNAMRLILLGNSYGALLAFEVACQIERHHAAVVSPSRLHLVVSGFRSPSLPPFEGPLHRLPRAHLLAELADRFGPQAAEAGDALASWQEAALRADLEACETYRLLQPTRLHCSTSVIQMTRDPSVTRAELAAWQAVSAHPVDFVTLDAGHFPWTTAAEEFGALLANMLKQERV
jgi:surfactin synthase thioesterase subunit